MEHLIVPAGYEPAIDLRETQIAIKIIKDFFQRELAKQLHLTRVSAPLFLSLIHISLPGFLAFDITINYVYLIPSCQDSRAR